MASYGGSGFNEFVDAELPRLLRLGQLLSGSPHDAWDLAQETLVRVGLAWSRVDAHGNPAAYAQRTLVRLHVSRWRQLRREVGARFLRDESVDVVQFGAVDDAAELAQALATLGPRQRAAVVLRYFDDLSVADVADRLGCSVGTAKSQLSRALERLREVLSAPPPPAEAAVTPRRVQRQ